jgi:tetratricopeptide (TPR) repeat protein
VIGIPLCPVTFPLSTLRVHLAHHLEELALFVLPLNFGDGSQDSGSIVAAVALGDTPSDVSHSEDGLSDLDFERGSDTSAEGQDPATFSTLLQSKAEAGTTRLREWVFQEEGEDGPETFPNSGSPENFNSPVLTEAQAYRKKLTTYAVYTLKKAIPTNPKELPTWACAEVIEERLDQGEIAKQMKRLSEKSVRSVFEQKAALTANQQGQVVKVLDELVSKERDVHFGWSLVQIGEEEQIKRKPSSSRMDDSLSYKTETTTLTVYAMRASLPNENCKMLSDLIEKYKIDIFSQHNRAPPNPQLYNQQNKSPPIVNNNNRPQKGHNRAYIVHRHDHSLGDLYMNQGKLNKAEKMYQLALQGYEKALGPDHTWNLDIVTN